jgi:hypothetical protein
VNPSIGRIVHFFIREFSVENPKCVLRPYPAIITKVHSSTLVDLVVFGGEFNGQEQTSVLFGNGELRTWAWPPRV